MKTYRALVTDKSDKSRGRIIIDSEYNSKKAFAKDLRANGYIIHTIIIL